MTQPKGYVDSQYLQITAQLLQTFKQRSYGLMQVQPGQHLLDVGCGPGTDTIPLARLVGPQGFVTGVDYDPIMLSEAEARAKLNGVSQRVKHVQVDVTEGLPFNSHSFDACRSERLFQHLARPAQVLGEMMRVTRPGGWIVVIDTDHGTRSIDTPEVDLERRLTRVATERCLINGYAGRQLYRLFREADLIDLGVETISIPFLDYSLYREVLCLDEAEQEALSAGLLAREELQRWRASLEQADRKGVFFASGTGVILAGRNPERV